MSALFDVEGDLVVPTDFARGPWDQRALHGGPTAALLARAIEGCPTDGSALEVTRITVELLRPVPVEPLRVEGVVVRPGRKVELVEASVRTESTGTEVARARALRIRAEAMALPGDVTVPNEPITPGPAGSRFERSKFASDYVAFHNSGSEHRYAAGSWLDPGPVTVWIRLLVPVVEGEVPSPLQRTVAAADFGNGVSRVLSWETHVFINPELSVHLLRPARGEWICLDARTELGPSGIGLAQSGLYDEDGRIGTAAQSLIVEERPAG